MRFLKVGDVKHVLTYINSVKFQLALDPAAAKKMLDLFEKAPEARLAPEAPLCTPRGVGCCMGVGRDAGCRRFAPACDGPPPAVPAA